MFKQNYILNKPEAFNFTKKETMTQVFFCEFWESKNTFFIEYIRTATSETVTENSLGNSYRGEKFSSRNEKLHIISIFSIRLTELKFLVQAKNIHIISPLDICLGSQYASAQKN